MKSWRLEVWDEFTDAARNDQGLRRSTATLRPTQWAAVLEVLHEAGFISVPAVMKSYPKIEGDVDEFVLAAGAAAMVQAAMIVAPTSKSACDELRRRILDLPRGFLARLYVDLYEATGLRIDGAKVEANKYYGGLT